MTKLIFIYFDEMVPKMVWFTEATRHDHFLLSKLKLDPNTIYVFDKGYNDYQAFKLFNNNNVGFVTRIKDNAVYSVTEELLIEDCIHSGVLEDTIIEFSFKDENKNFQKVKLKSLI